MKSHPASRQLELDPGESLFFHSKAGSALISTAGTLLVTGAPRWLGEQLVCNSTVLESGQAHTLDQDGWITVTAQHGGAVCVVAQKGRPWPWAALVSACVAVFGRYRSAKPV
ncbi:MULTISPECIES: hypothetical protein [unclassified Polaromonas]|uniref:hypothetical protein n=1 Tax=unclassified Polaromonas TaxID=2638319 RepID=UPI000F08972C|nr:MULTISPECIES: hypothetical protein [unclassified Polaromonas]AYQ29806.1 hypothetical protein DT070_18370 [Polaromonas sp. SP1]QGJ19077.1 hypothetical protein F7R28_12210 [Polaromonas sp. Pch-P]